MKALLLYACVLTCADAARFVQPPECKGDACVERDVADINGGWFSKDYLVNGKKMSVATQYKAIRWTCWGNDPTSSSAPHYSSKLPLSVAEVELIDCNIPSTSYDELFTLLSLSSGVETLTISNRPQNINWPSMEELQAYNKDYKNEKGEWVAAVAADLPRNSLKFLSLRGTPMTTEQLISIYNIWTLTLVDTGLTKVVNLSEYTKLHRLELHEPMLEDAQLLGTAPALDELVLRAPDAGLAPMPLLRVATFLDVYAMGSIFGHCRKLEELTIKGGDLDRIHEHWLAGCTSLSKLKLTRLPNLRSLPSDLLSDTTNLRELDLSHNSLESLPKDLFSNVKKLTDLNLMHNFLKTLPIKLFPGSKSLKYVCVSHNSDSLDEQLLSNRPRWYNKCNEIIIKKNL